jgi:hypothetical protein
MATLRFLDPPKAPDQVQRESQYGDYPTTARSSRQVRIVLWALGIATVTAFALIVFVILTMIQAKERSIAALRADYALESLDLTDGSGRSDAIDCWRGSTINLVARVKNQNVVTPASSSTVTVNLSGGLAYGPGRDAVEQTIVLPGSSMPSVGRTVDVPFSVDVQPWMQNRSLTWTVLVTGSDDEPPNRGNLSTTIKPCAERV